MIGAAARLAFVLAVAAARPPALFSDFEEAQARYQALDDERALELVRAHLATHPRDAAAIELEARCLVELGRTGEARARLDAVEQLSIPGRLLLAECRAALGEGPLALATVDVVLRERPQLLEARLARIRINTILGNLRPAALEIAELRRAAPNRVDVLPLLARLKEESRRYAEALELHRAIVADPKRYESLDPHVVRHAQSGVARVHFLRGEFEQAAAAWGELVRAAPGRAELHYRLGMSLGMAKRSLEAIASLERALELDPELDECRLRLAELYRNKQMTAEAVAAFERLHERPAWREPAARALAELAARGGDLERAAAYARELEPLRPQTADQVEVRGLVAERCGDATAAIALYRRCIELDPLRFDVVYRLALLLVRGEDDAGRAEGAALLERYQRIVPVLPDLDATVAALRLTPDNPHWIIRLAGILNVAGEYGLARARIERALEVRGDDPLALGIAGCIAANQRRDEAALELFEKAQKLAGERPDPTVQGYIDALRRGEPLALPVGELVRGAK